MSREYRKETENKAKEKISNMLSLLPPYVSLYNNHISLSTSPKTRLGYIGDIKTFFEYLIDACDKDYESIKEIPLSQLESLNLDFFNAYLNYLTYYEKDGVQRENGNSAIRRKLSSLRGFYSYLYINDMVSATPINKVSIPKVNKKNLIRMDNNETKDYIETVEQGLGKLSKKETAYHEKYGTRDTAIMHLLLSTGIRVSELVGLDINDLDLKRSCIKVIRKGNKEDIVYFNDNTVEIMDYYLLYRKKLDALEGHENALFLSSQRKRLSVRSVEKLVEKYSKRTESLGLKHITPHKLRSTMGTELYNRTGDLYLVAEVLGHESVETTKKHYTEVTDQRKYDKRNILLTDFSNNKDK